MKITDLKHLGLTEKEAKIYMACLELGYASVQGLARKAGTNRVAVYTVLEDMKKQGLINTAYKGKRKVYVAAKPEMLLDILKEKQDVIKEEIANYKTKMLPELISIYNKAEDKPRIKYYDVKEGVGVMRDEILNSDDKIVYSIVPLSKIPEKYKTPKSVLIQMQKAGKIFKELCIGNSTKDIRVEEYVKRFIKTDKDEDIDCEIYANDGKVYINRFSKKPFVIIIEDISIYNVIKYLIKISQVGINNKI